jgi:transposase-like protein
MKESVKKVRRGSIVYTDKWKGYDSLMRISINSRSMVPVAYFV